MKKRISVLVAAVLAIGCIATACGGNAGGEVKVGLGAHTDFTYGSHNIGDEVYGQAVTETTAQADIHVAAVMVDANGKIVSCKIDAIQLAGKVDATGKLLTDVSTEFKTKKELKEDYGMKGASAGAGKIEGGKEWYEQAEAFELWCVGKTLDEIKNMGLSDGYPTDSTLTTGCTIKVNCIQQAVIRAIEGATWTGASSNDTLGLGLVGELTSNADATAEANGKVQAYANFAAVAQNAEGKITCAVIDSVQANSTWDTTGKLTHDLTKEPTTKYNLKEDYNMKGTSATIGKIEGGKEWYEQIEVFMGFINGKTSSEVAAITVNEEGKTTDTTLSTGCTMTITAYQEAVVKALAK
ncbi:MAG: hypothetical protein IJ419_16800 [Agathobacter sp.]|nr:hypothetical protein [Agathobacter sp.]